MNLTYELLAAISVGLLTLAGVLKLFWEMVIGYEYPVDIKDNRWAELAYTARERGAWMTFFPLALAIPALASVLTYIFAVGLQEVLFG